MNLKVAQVCPRYSPYFGGIEKHVEEISKRLAERGWKVEVLTGDPDKALPAKETRKCVKVRRFPSLSPSDSYHFFLGLRGYLNGNDFGLIHAHGFHALPAFQASLFRGGKKLVLTPHYKGFSHSTFRNFLYRIYKPVGKRIFRRADRVICVSLYEKDRVIKDFGIQEDKICLVPNGVDFEEFENSRAKLEGSPDERRTILTVGRLESYKGIQYLIRALTNLNSNVCLEIVGKGPFKDELLRLAQKLDVKDRVYFSQDLPRQRLVEKYVEADVFVLLSRYEAYGMVIAEALASGTPCIVAKTTALSEWIDNESCFGISYPIDTADLAKLIQKNLRKEIHYHENGRIMSWDRVVDKLENIYLDLVEKR